MNQTFEDKKKEFLKIFKDARPLLNVLGDEVRQDIIAALIETGGQGGIRVGEIQYRSNISRSSVSHHLKILLDAGVISRRREGTKNFYFIDFKTSTLRPLIEFCQQAEPMLIECLAASKECLASQVSNTSLA